MVNTFIGHGGGLDMKYKKLRHYLNLQSSCKGHFKRSLHVLSEHPLEGLLEQRCIEGVCHHHIPSATQE